MSDIMLDLETMGSGPDAAIVAIGAVEFDAKTQTIGHDFYHRIDLASAVRDGGVIDAETVIWWLSRSDAARAEITAPGRENIISALAAFTAYVQFIAPECRIWGNGASFDNVILRRAYERVGMPPPWNYYNDRCYRTLKSLRPDIKLDRSGTHHHALDDAITQARHAMEVMEVMAVFD